MSSTLHPGFWKITRLLFRLILVVATVMSTFAFIVQPVSAEASIDHIVNPAPPYSVPNDGSEPEYAWWRVTYEPGLTPDHMVYKLLDPDLNEIPAYTHVYENLTSEYDNGTGLYTIFNPENTVGQSAHGIDTNYAHILDNLSGFPPGSYTSQIEFFSSTGQRSYSGTPFLIRQPVTIFKYYDHDGHGDWDEGIDEPLENWEFTVSGPAGQEWYYTGKVNNIPTPDNLSFAGVQVTAGFPASGEHLIVNYSVGGENDLGSYSYSDITGMFTLTDAADDPPEPGQYIKTIPVTTFTGVTNVDGKIELPNGVQVSGNYTFTEMLQLGWVNTDPGGAYPYHRDVAIPEDLDQADPIVRFGNREAVPLIDIVKWTNGADHNSPPGLYIPNVGDPVTWTYIVTNPGEDNLTDIKVTDDHAGVTPVYQTGDDGDGILQPGETWYYTAEASDGAIEGYYHNIGTVVGTPPTGDNVTNYDDEYYYTTVEGPPPVPASSGMSLWLMVGFIGGTIALLTFRRVRRAPR
jgi:hypothetical protein